MQQANPFNSAMAHANSSYSAFRENHLVNLALQAPAPNLAQFVHGQLRALITDPQFSCLGAKSAINQNTYRFGMYPPMNSPEATAGLGHDIYLFVNEQLEMNSKFTTFIACFTGPNPVDESHFEHMVWSQLQRLHDNDVHHWDSSVSADPSDERFSFSIGGRAYFIVGLHPGSSRWVRRFGWPTLVFNAHYQFEHLREAGNLNLCRKPFAHGIQNYRVQ